MEDKKVKNKAFTGILVFTFLLCGCEIYLGSGCQNARFTKVVHMPAVPLSPGLNFKTQTHNGSIDVHGADVFECNVVATITGRASSDEKAEDIVEKTKLRFEQSESGLVFIIEKPEDMFNCSVGVSLDVTLPNEINLNLVSHNGKIELENIIGNTNATTHNGKVSAKNISGTTNLNTHNGKIKAIEVSGDIDLLSHNGKVEAVFSQDAEPDCDITMVTHNGSLDLTTPQNYSAKVKVSTHNGHIDNDLPIVILGVPNEKKLVGTIGEAKGNMTLTTYNGSIKIK